MASLENKRKKSNDADIVANLEKELKSFKKKSKVNQRKIRDLEAQLDEKEDLLQPKLKTNAISKDFGLDNRTCAMGDTSNEPTLMEKIETLENTNQKLIKALSDADQAWATLEEDYKQRLITMENQYEAKLIKANLEIERLSTEMLRLIHVEEEYAALKAQMELTLEENCAQEEKLKMVEKENKLLVHKLEGLGEMIMKKSIELKLSEESARLAEKEIALEKQLAELTTELSRMKKVSDLEETTSELREEVEELEAPESIEVRITLVLEDNSSMIQKPDISEMVYVPFGADERSSAATSVSSFHTRPEKIATFIAEMYDMLKEFESPFQKHVSEPALLSIQSSRLPNEEKSDDVEGEIADLNLKSQSLFSSLRELEDEWIMKDPELESLELELKQSMEELEARIHHERQLTHRLASSESLTPPATPLSTLQLGLHNLLLKCRTKTGIAKTLLGLRDSSRAQFSLRDGLPLLDRSDVTSYASSTNQSDNPIDSSFIGTSKSAENSVASKVTYELASSVSENLVGKIPSATLSKDTPPLKQEKLKIVSAVCDNPKRRQCSENVNHELALHRSNPIAHMEPAFPIKAIRKIGAQSLMIEWDNRKVPNSVTGYEISVNGLVYLKLRHRDRTRAIIHGVTMTGRVLVSVHPVTAEGRISTPAFAVYPPLLL